MFFLFLFNQFSHFIFHLLLFLSVVLCCFTPAPDKNVYLQPYTSYYMFFLLLQNAWTYLVISFFYFIWRCIYMFSFSFGVYTLYAFIHSHRLKYWARYSKMIFDFDIIHYGNALRNHLNCVEQLYYHLPTIGRHFIWNTVENCHWMKLKRNLPIIKCFP